MLRFLSFVLLALVLHDLAGQTLPDSVKQKFSGLAHDSVYVNRLNEEASTYLRSNPAISRSICTHVLEVSTKIKYTKGYARALTVMGNAYWYEGIYEFAQNYYLLAARQYQSIRDSIGLGYTYNNIGEVYKKLSEYDKALEYLSKSAQLKKSDHRSKGLTLYNIGELYIRLNKVDSARKYIDAAHEVAQEENNKRVIAFTYWSYAELKALKSDYKSAIELYLKSENIWNELGETRSLIQTYQELAELFNIQRKFEASEFYLEKAIKLASRIKVADLQVKNYFKYAQLDSLRGNYKSAFYYLSRHNALKDSVYNLLKAEQIARILAIYETETREAENKQLKTDRAFKDQQLESQQSTLIAISICLFIVVMLAWILYRQRKRILLQKNAIEIQATALLKLNDELVELNKTLEVRINERTSQLTIQNQRLAEYTFINAHKLRAPVASILGLINLLDQGAEDEREMILRHLRTCGEQLDDVIHQVSRNLEAAIVTETEKEDSLS
jgi:tetratricopeptide (TPR) repeat protein